MATAKSPHPSTRTRRRRGVFVRAVAVVALVFAGAAASVNGALAANASADLDQCANGGVGDPHLACAGAQWQNGNLNGNQAHYPEGESVPYRMRFDNLDTTAGNTHSVTIEWDTTNKGTHAIDYLTSFDRTETLAMGNDPTSGVTGLNLATFDTIAIPADANAVNQISGVFTMWGGDLTAVSGYTYNGTFPGGSSTASLKITFTATVANPVLAWGGHISNRLDWGASAILIRGASYHVRLDNLDGAGGNQDRSLATSAVTYTSSITVDKTATPTSVTAPGAPVTFNVVVTNTANTAVDITTLTDDKFGDITSVQGAITATTCTVTQNIAAGGNYPCSFTANVTGAAGTTHVDTVTATGTSQTGAPVTAFDDASVSITGGGGPPGPGPQPAIDVVKTAAPTSVPEPGGDVTFTVVVTNTASESMTVTALVDDVYGNLDGKGTCDLTPPVALAPGAKYTCAFTGAVAGNAGSSHTDTVTVTAHDASNAQVTHSDPATVTITDVMPTLTIVKTASADVVHVGEAVTYTYKVTTDGPDAVLDVKVTDDKCSPVTYTAGDTNANSALEVGETWTYTCTTTLTGDTVNTATATGHDDEGNDVTATDQATVQVIDAKIAITKVASAPFVTVGDTVTYTYTVTNPGTDPLSQVKVTDDKCSPVTYVGGDVDSDALLDVDEAWVYRCSTVIAAPVTVTNVGTVAAVDAAGDPITASASATVSAAEVLGEQIVKTPPLATTGGDPHRSLAVAAALIALGAVLVFASRRRAAPES